MHKYLSLTALREKNQDFQAWQGVGYQSIDPIGTKLQTTCQSSFNTLAILIGILINNVTFNMFKCVDV